MRLGSAALARWSALLWLASLVPMASCVAAPDVVAVDRGQLGQAGTGPAAAGAPTKLDGGASTGTGGTAGTTSVVQALTLSGDLQTHDSCVIEAEGRYHLFYTGPGIRKKTSEDLLTWRDDGNVFDENPTWIASAVPDATDLWAPDVSWVDGEYHLYYAASTFGTGRSCIGHATIGTLDGSEAWVDQGSVICSDIGGEDVDDWDAIDPNTLTDLDGSRWMVFGSFSSGIKLIRLDVAGARTGDEFYSLAARPEGAHAIQAPFLMYRAPYYYLFVSFDYCCQGVSSTYNIRVGRATELTGPYTDREGVPMLEGGGTLLLEGNDRWRGVGANTILSTRGRDYNIYHSYDANAAGQATLRISEVAWDAEGWPIVGGP